ncbi:hypothetical protein PGTUg99_033721 [Puccinia graminis f. sp. tritici]|uniref:Uncharacterized protein n=1 Tax=Puccinia graminis f. sp. tritici TaxID=56615 RepID=A0A5B0S7Y3_PUCGR|nr:hypothetical protein PGTUg99_033721 [Puccinia graminis f. sp. tritici]
MTRVSLMDLIGHKFQYEDNKTHETPRKRRHKKRKREKSTCDPIVAPLFSTAPVVTPSNLNSDMFATTTRTLMATSSDRTGSSQLTTSVMITAPLTVPPITTPACDQNEMQEDTPPGQLIPQPITPIVATPAPPLDLETVEEAKTRKRRQPSGTDEDLAMIHPALHHGDDLPFDLLASINEIIPKAAVQPTPNPPSQPSEPFAFTISGACVN